MRRFAGLLITVPALLLAALVLSANPARAFEKEVMEDVVVEKGDTVEEVSTAWGDVLVEGEVEEYVRTGLGDIEIEGPVGGDVQTGSGDVYINALVKGDVKVGSGNVYLGPEARVEGDVSCGGGRLESHPSAVVIGAERAGFSPELGGEGSGVSLDAAGWALMTLVLAAVAVLATVALPRPLRAATRSLELSPGRSLVLGLGSLPAAIILSILLAITGVGLVLLFLLWPAYLALVFFGLFVTAYFLGRKVVLATGRYRAGDALAAAVGAVLVAAAYQIPIFGGLVFAVLALIGAGAAFSALLSRRDPGVPRPSYASYEDYLKGRRDA
jgi:cytoskeletal protein CcmA (bactofilin family)